MVWKRGAGQDLEDGEDGDDEEEVWGCRLGWGGGWVEG